MPGRFHESPPMTPINVPLSGVGTVYTTGVGAFYSPPVADPPWWVAYTKAISERKMDRWHDASFKYGYEAGVRDGEKSCQDMIARISRRFDAADAQLDRIRDVIDEGFE